MQLLVLCILESSYVLVKCWNVRRFIKLPSVFGLEFFFGKLRVYIFPKRENTMLWKNRGKALKCSFSPHKKEAAIGRELACSKQQRTKQKKVWKRRICWEWLEKVVTVFDYKEILLPKKVKLMAIFLLLDQILPNAQFTYNSSRSGSTQISPFEIVFGSNSTNVLVLVPIKKPDKLVVMWMQWPVKLRLCMRRFERG